MKKTIYCLPYLLLFALSSLFCGKDDMPDNNNNNNPTPAPQYEPCCGANDPVEYEEAAAGIYVYVPNTFTPNDDGINDLFYPHSDPNDSLSFKLFTIFSVVNDTVIYEADWFYPEFTAQTAWDGNRSDGTPYEGLFRYSVLVGSPSGIVRAVQGKACRIVCGPEAEVFQTKEGCFYSEQADITGHLDSTLASNESGCFQ